MTTQSQEAWKRFRECGLLFFVNQSLHFMGWAIVVTTEEDGTISDVHPERVSYRGFATESQDKGHIKVAKYLAEEAAALLKDVTE